MKLKIFFEDLKKGQKIFGENIAIIVNSILLTFVYFFGIGLTSIFGKIFKKSFLDEELNEKSKTYWEELNLEKKPVEEYYRQF